MKIVSIAKSKKKGTRKTIIETAHLIENHGFSSQSEPIWQDGCVEPEMYRELTAGLFRPALGNSLIVGDAAGMNIPVSPKAPRKSPAKSFMRLSPFPALLRCGIHPECMGVYFLCYSVVYCGSSI